MVVTLDESGSTKVAVVADDGSSHGWTLVAVVV